MVNLLDHLLITSKDITNCLRSSQRCKHLHAIVLIVSLTDKTKIEILAHSRLRARSCFSRVMSN